MPELHDFPTSWLRVFLEVARAGSFTAAARTLGYTQSAVSRQVSALEDEAGAALFDRLPRGVRLTEAGRGLLPYARSVLEQLDSARRDLAALRGLTAGRLRVGAFATAGASLVPRAIAAFHARYPQVEVTLDVDLSARLISRMAGGELDVAVISVAPGAGLPAGIGTWHLLDEVMLVALPRGHRLAGRRVLRLAELADECWIAGSSRPQDTLIGSVLGSGFRPRIGFVTGEWIAKQGLVAAGLGVTLIPALAADAVRADIALVSVHPDDVPVRTVLGAIMLDGTGINTIVSSGAEADGTLSNANTSRGTASTGTVSIGTITTGTGGNGTGSYGLVSNRAESNNPEIISPTTNGTETDGTEISATEETRTDPPPPGTTDPGTSVTGAVASSAARIGTSAIIPASAGPSGSGPAPRPASRAGSPPPESDRATSAAGSPGCSASRAAEAFRVLLHETIVTLPEDTYLLLWVTILRRTGLHLGRCREREPPVVTIRSSGVTSSSTSRHQFMTGHLIAL